MISIALIFILLTIVGFMLYSWRTKHRKNTAEPAVKDTYDFLARINAPTLR